ncbi:MAG: hypothetical protein SW127_19560, partial [Actinomycetota bacterium]|nr:hypothetical protein [Actinomycetota bacterium]
MAVNALICESGADTSWPFDSSGDRYNSFRVSSSGEIMWAQGNLGGAETFQMDYLTYHAVGWTIRAEMNGTTFT